MPVAAIIPVALAAASAIAGNVQQKAANKNNLNQQAGAVQNAKNAYGNAQTSMANLIKNDPSPFAGQTVQQPGAMPGTGQANMAGHVLGQPVQPQPPPSLGSVAQPGQQAPSPVAARRGIEPIARYGGPTSAANPTSLARLIMQTTAA